MQSEYSTESALKSDHDHAYSALWLQPHGALRTEVLRIYEGDRGLPLPENSRWERSDSRNDAICMHLKEPRSDDTVFFGNWQADIIRAEGKSTAVGVLMETSSLFTLLMSLDDKSVPTAISEFAQILNHLDVQKALSISSGKSAEVITNFTPCLKSAINVYFFDPTLACPIGIHENVRPYLRAKTSKEVDIVNFSQDELNKLAFEINADRRKVLDWKCPLELFMPEFFGFKYDSYSHDFIEPRLIRNESRARPRLSSGVRNNKKNPRKGTLILTEKRALVIFSILPLLLSSIFYLVLNLERFEDAADNEFTPSAEVLKLQTQAERGVVEAQFRLGLMYAEGRDSNGNAVIPHRAQAMKWYGLAAEHGSAPAQFALAQLYETDNPMPEDSVASAAAIPSEPSPDDNAAAVRWYRAAADQGYAPAQLRLGRRYALGNGVPRDPNEAVRLLRLSDPQAAIALEEIEMFGLLYARGGHYIGHSPYQYMTIQANFEVADVFLREAWAGGSRRAPEEYGDMYVRGIRKYLKYENPGIWAGKEEDSSWDSKKLFEAVTLASAEIAFEITGVKSAAKEAVSAYELAVERGSTSAAYKLGEMFVNGIGVGKNIAAAERWYRKAVDGGSEDAAFQIGEIYFHGKGGNKNVIDAERWYRRAGLKGSEKIQEWAPKKLDKKTSTKKSEQVSSLVDLGAAHLGDASAQLSTGRAYYSGEGLPRDYGEAAKWFCMAAKQGDKTGQFLCGLVHDFGQGVTEDNAEAAKWYRLAADQEFAPAQARLGLQYLSGKGVPQDFEQAISLLRLSAENKYATAQAALGDVYMFGRGVDRDFNEALQWYRLAADQGDAYAQRKIGDLYLQGRGVQRDAAEAMKWYWFAAKQGDGIAQKNLGDMYVRGKPVGRDYVLGYMWYNLAVASEAADDAENLREKLAGKMTAAQTREAQQLASACRERNYQECYGDN